MSKSRLLQLGVCKLLIRNQGIVPVLAGLLKRSRTTEYAYLCNPAVDHVSKLKKEGGFCGYRNIQMLSSYIVNARAEGAHCFSGRMPSVFGIQEYIERAWDNGINAQGRIETGGVRGTRKYIGTPEVGLQGSRGSGQGILTRHLGTSHVSRSQHPVRFEHISCIGSKLTYELRCNAQGFKDQRPGNAEARLLQHVEQYFQQSNFDPADKVRCTRLPPIYFQHRGHSLTIVGYEKKKNGTQELLVFDPMFRDSDAVVRLAGSHKPSTGHPENMLKLYRRGNRYLKRFQEFEVLK